MPIPSTGRARLAVSAVVLLAALSALPGVAIHARATFAPEKSTEMPQRAALSAVSHSLPDPRDSPNALQCDVW